MQRVEQTPRFGAPVTGVGAAPSGVESLVTKLRMLPSFRDGEIRGRHVRVVLVDYESFEVLGRFDEGQHRYAGDREGRRECVGQSEVVTRDCRRERS